MSLHDHAESTDAPSPVAATTSDTEARFTRLVAASFLLLHSVTYSLWGWSSNAYPSLAIFPDRLRGFGVHPFLLVCPMLVAWAALLCKPKVRWLWWCAALPLALLIALDQHRLQPWAYQTLLYAILLGSVPWERSRNWIIALTISIYFYSSIGKLDFQFVHTVGRDMTAAMLSPLGEFTPGTLTGFAFALPIGELCVAVLLMLPATRRVAGCLALAMHVTLIGLLGPWAMNHSLGVLVWNAMLATQAWLLFVKREPVRLGEQDQSLASVEQRRTRPLRYIAQGLMVFVLVAPLGERHQWWDHWTSWALYSPHNSRAEIEVHETVAEKLPSEARQFLLTDEDGDGWSVLDFEAWSLTKRGVPIYPQARYQIGIAYELAKTHDLGQGIRATRKDASDRWSGKRSEKRVIGIEELEALR